MKKISVIIPVYYNAESLPELFAALQQLERDLLARGVELELIFVDDGSGDASLAELLKIREQRPATLVIKHSRNLGAVRAVKTAYHHVGGDCFTFLAADLQDPPGLILQMVERWLNGAKYVICTREARRDPLLTRLFARIYYLLLKTLVVPGYPPGGFDLALMDRVMLPYLLKSPKNVNLSLFAYSLGFKPEVIPYLRQARQHGKSRWTFAKKVSYFLDSLLGFSIIPIRMISLIGGAVSLVSFVYGVLVIISALFGGMPVRGYAALATLISFLLGLAIVMLGVIGEYIWRIFDEVSGRPESVVEETYPPVEENEPQINTDKPG
jgi:polyisoprenyl-phosphate glycosyltransferase